jgi:hypothetical protein
VNQSPFNVGTRLSLEDFTPQQVARLNRLYDSPLRGEEELKRFLHLLGGHPYLIRRALQEMTRYQVPFDQVEALADSDDWIFGDHLRRIRVLLARDVELCGAFRSLLQGWSTPRPEHFYRLRSSGLLTGAAANDARIRCGLYARYLGNYLLNAE